MQDLAIEQRIEQIYDDLPPTQQRLANCILNHRNSVFSYSASELAQLAQVSKSAVTRLLQRLEYKNFSDAKRHNRTQNRWYQTATEHHQTNEFKEYIDCDQHNISATLSSIAKADFYNAVELIAKAKRVFVIGYRNNYALALHLRQQLTQCRENVMLLPIPGQTLGEEIASFTQTDVIIVMGVRRRPAWLKNIMSTLHQKGLQLIYITDHADANPKAVSVVHFSCAVRGVSAFDSYASIMCVISMMANGVYQACHHDARSRIQSIEETYQTLNELDMEALNNGALVDQLEL
ncbi:MurR/RpiR family transcriptional regulator [Marinomonas agarivorans]|nr:MurR/RpiR family transcriptional regulator [Marinomonas agarivorans]